MPNTHEQQSALHRAYSDKTYCALLDEAEKGLSYRPLNQLLADSDLLEICHDSQSQIQK